MKERGLVRLQNGRAETALQLRMKRMMESWIQRLRRYFEWKELEM